MEQNGASNGQQAKLPQAKLQKSPPASGASKSPKKRRKVNHGTSGPPRQEMESRRETSTDLEARSCSVCVLPPICKSCMGSRLLEVLEGCEYAQLAGTG